MQNEENIELKIQYWIPETLLSHLPYLSSAGEKQNKTKQKTTSATVNADFSNLYINFEITW